MIQSRPLSGLKILVVEDEFYLADDVHAALRAAGAEVHGPFQNGDEALSALGDTPIDMAVLDINTGGGPSFHTAETLLARGVEIVFVTGYDTAVIPLHLRHIRCLQKPVSEARILAALEEVHLAA